MSILNMKQQTLVLLFILYFTSVSAQRYAKLVIDNARVVYADKEYISGAELNVHKWSRTTYSMDGAFNLTKNIPDTVSVQLTLCQIIGDECPAVVEVYEKNICKFLHDEFADWFPSEYLSNQNFISKCPIKKDNYSFKKYMPVEHDYTALSILWKHLQTDLFFNYKGKTLLHLYWQSNMLTNL